MIKEEAGLLSIVQVMRRREIVLMWTGQTMSSVGDLLALYALYTNSLFTLHASISGISLLSLASLAPFVLVGPAAGLAASRFGPQKVMLASDLVRALLVLLLLLPVSTGGIAGILFAVGCCSAISVPAGWAVIKEVTPDAGVLSVNRLTAQTAQAIQVLCPFLAGAIIQRLPLSVCIAFDSLSFIISFFCVRRVVLRAREYAPPGTSPGDFLESLRNGYRQVRTSGTLQQSLIALSIQVLAINCFGLGLSILVRDVLRRDAGVFGWLHATIAIGVITGANVLPATRRFIGERYLLISGLLGVASCIELASFRASFWIIEIVCLLIGIFSSWILIAADSHILMRTSSDSVTTVASVVSVVAVVMQLVGIGITNILEPRFGVAAFYGIVGASIFVIAVACCLPRNSLALDV